MSIEQLAREPWPDLPEPPFAPTVPGMLHAIAERYGGQEAIVRGDDRLTFAGLEQRSADLARGLLALGLGKGSRVALLMPNTVDFVVCFMAAARIGAVVLPMSTLYQARELKWVLNHADIDTLLTVNTYLSHDYVERLQAAFPALEGQFPGELYLPDAPFLRRVLLWGDCQVPWAELGPRTLEQAAADRPAVDAAFLGRVEACVTPADHLCMIYTSGSTADPKGVVHYHGSMMRHAYHMPRDYYPFASGERFVAARPWFWIAGLSSSLLFTLQSGVCLIVPDDESAAEAERLIDEERASLFGTLPAYFARLNAHFESNDRDLRVLQISSGVAGLARCGADGAFRFVSEHFEALVPASQLPVPHNRIPSSYGMTETLATHTCERPPTLIPEHKAGASGRAVPGVERKIVDPETGRELPPGEVGELYVRGYLLMAGLHKKERAEVFDADGYYPTGDACSIDAEGCLTFKSRLGEMIKVSGANVAPLEVEQLIMVFDEVENCAVVGLPQPGGYDLLVAAVVLLPRAELDEAEVIRRLKADLSSFKVPKRVFFLADESLPRTATGKIRKLDLIDQLAALK